MHLLVTGGAGFIGRNLISYLAATAPRVRVTILDAISYAADVSALADFAGGKLDYRLIAGDIRDSHLVHACLKDVDAVIHLAAETSVDRSWRDPGPFLRTNVLGTISVIRACAERSREGPLRLVHVSTDEVFGSLRLDQAASFNERSPLRPQNPYAQTKAIGEEAVMQAVQCGIIEAIVATPTNAYGLGQHPEKLIPKTVGLLRRGEPVPLFDDGAAVRDWLHVDDLVAGLMCLLHNGVSGERYCIGASNERSNLQTVQAIAAVMGVPARVTFGHRRPLHDQRYAVNAAKLRALGWKPRRQWEEALSELARIPPQTHHVVV